MKILSLIFLFSIYATGKTIYVDPTLTTKCHTYSPAARDCSGSDWAFKTVQMAVDSMASGDVISIRGGTYLESNITLSQAKNGTAWTAGNFNTIKSYPGEWAILDGQNQCTNSGAGSYVIGYASNEKGGAASLKYWKFDHLEIMRGGQSDSSGAAGFAGNSGPFWFTHCYVHDNMANTPGSNPGGLKGAVWDGCDVEYCYFTRNGDPTYHGDFTIMSDYNSATAEDGFTFINEGYHRGRNNYRYNLFDGSRAGISDKNGQFYCGRNPDAGHGYDDTYKSRGDNVHHNIFRHISYIAVFSATDFNQIHNNIFDSCAIPILVGSTDEPIRYANVVYNNTIITSASAPGIRWSHVNYYEQLARFNDPSDYYGYGYNNILDKCQNTYNGEDLTLAWSSSFARADTGVHHFYINRNYFYSPADTATIWYGRAGQAGTLYSIAKYKTIDAAALQFSNAYNAGDLLYTGTTGSSRLITRGAHVLNGDTTIANGGRGGAHPYLDDTSIPSYVGATDPSSNTWVDSVYNLATTIYDTTVAPTAKQCLITIVR
jgi:hypothetical protein